MNSTFSHCRAAVKYYNVWTPEDFKILWLSIRRSNVENAIAAKLNINKQNVLTFATTNGIY